MRGPIGILLLVVAVVLAGCQPVTVEQATATYCQSLQSFRASLQALRALDETSTVDEVQATLDLVQAAYWDMQQAAAGLTGAELDAIDQAYDSLRNVQRDIEGSMTITEVQATVQTSAAEVEAAWEQLYADANCVSASATPAP